MKKLLATTILLALILGGAVFAMQQNRGTSQNSGKLEVVATYYPLYDFARHVGGNKVHVINETPAGAEPHDYEPSPKALASASAAAVFVYNGGHMEPWTAGFLSDYQHVAIKASQGIELLSTNASSGEGAVQDPHFWLDPVLAQKIVTNIRDGLTKADPANKEYYAKNASAYNAKLAQLDVDFAQGLARCKIRTVISSHDAFGYIGKRYNLQITAIAGVSPEEEPSAQKLAQLSKLARDRDVRYIFFESLVSPRLADTIAAETGAKTLVFDPIEGLSNEAQKQGKDYLGVQRENLASLRVALACQ